MLSDQSKKFSKDTATGVDGWAVRDLVHMQPRLWNLLAELLRLVEEVGVWPSRLPEGFIALVPKGEGAGPLQLRPLLVLSVVYRLWAGIRLADAMRWQEGWIHPEAYGFRTGRGAMDAASLLQVLVELVGAGGLRSLSGFGLDYKKCFDPMP